jgi:hypothetical protein
MHGTKRREPYPRRIGRGTIIALSAVTLYNPLCLLTEVFNTVVRLVIRILYCPVQIPKYYLA